MPDYVQDDIATYVHVLPDDYATEDEGFTRYGSDMLDFCKQTGLRTFNGRVGDDGNIGKGAYMGSTGKNLIDYVISSEQLFPLINTFDVVLSDLCVVNFSLRSHRTN